MIKIGPAGIGGKKEAKENLIYYSKNNFKAAEISFTYSTYLKKEGNREKDTHTQKTVTLY